MKGSLSLLALASTALAANIPRGGGGGHKDGWGDVVTSVVVTYTTVCPVTETVTKEGKPHYTTYTTTSVVTEVVPTTIYTTIEEIKTKSTKVTAVVPTTVHTTVKDVDTKTAWTTYVETAWKETKVYETVTCPETVITTISAGHTIYVTKTNTITKVYTDVKTFTTKLPITLTKEYDVTVGITKPGHVTVTGYETVVVTKPNTVFSSVPAPPTTVIIPTTSTAVPRPPSQTTSSTSIATAGANAQHKMPAGVAFVAGLFGAVVML